MDWRSPILEDHYAEYRTSLFLTGWPGSWYYRTPEQPQYDLADFWPRFGPQWDGLAVTDRGQILLVEAKAHIPEMVTAPTQARGESARQKIQDSLGRVKAFVNSKAPVDWSTSFYQYANRLAHLYWDATGQRPRRLLGQPVLHQRPGDERPGIRGRVAGAIRLQEVFLGVRQSSQTGYALDSWVGAHILDVFIDVNDIPVLYPPQI